MESEKIQRLNTISQMILTESEINKLNAFRAMCVEEVHGKIKNNEKACEEFTDDEYLTRLLVARNWTVKKAYDMWLEAVKFKVEFQPENIKESEMMNPLSSGKLYYHGFDKDKRPILILSARRFNGATFDHEQEFRFVIYMLEKGKELSKNSVDGKITILWDRKGFTKKNFSKKYVTSMKKALKVVADNYPEILYRFYILKPNFFFKTFLILCRPFMSERTKNKFKLINDVKQLKEYFSEDNLLIEHGGTSKYIYSFNGVQVIDQFTHNGNIEEGNDNDEDVNIMSKEILIEEGLEDELKNAMENSPTKVK